MTHKVLCSVVVVAIGVGMCGAADGPQVIQSPPLSESGGAATLPPAVPPDYVIGAQDLLSIVFWREKEMSTDVVVRPDGKISLPLLQDVDAAGYTPKELTGVLVRAASKYVSQPNATVIVKEINSRKVFIVGQVARPGGFPLTGDMTVLQLIALAGDVLEYAKSKDVVIVRKENHGERRFNFNYKDVIKGKHVEQNILLSSGDTVIVP
jgi:polysaccharide biosynthesis/export protein